jgi:glycosyltransferase involved in cell wall biosynthesis
VSLIESNHSSDSGTAFVAVGLPIYNEEQNLSALLDLLIGETYVHEIVAVDDGSSDASPQILQSYAARSPKVRPIRTGGRNGQLAAWITAAKSVETPVIAFVDADARPAPGAIRSLAERIVSDPACVIASGRVMPTDCTGFPASRFRGEAVHRIRLLGYPRDTMIGRFFAVRREWFLESATRADIIANDAYLGCLAARQQRVSRYVPEAVCYYTEASVSHDFAAQRQRADAGYRQLREMGLLERGYEPKAADYAKLLSTAALRDPVAAASWFVEQVKAKFRRAYSTGGGHNGIWETQASTKRRLTL